MKKAFILLFVILFVSLGLSQTPHNDYKKKEVSLQKSSTSLKLQNISFEENKGQVIGQDAAKVKYTCKVDDLSIFLMENGIAYQFSKIHYPKTYKQIGEFFSHEEKQKMQELRKDISIETYRMDIELVGANSNLEISTEGKRQDYVQYYNHNVLDVHSYNKITYHNVYPNIDWVIYTQEGDLKYDFVVNPGGNPALIQLKTKWVEDIKITENGSLELKNQMGTITEQAPTSFQGEKEIKTQFSINENIISFNVENYDPNQTLIIDPLVRVWGTYHGGNNDDIGYSCVVDASGNIYQSGETASTSSIASGGHDSTYGGGNWDAFLAKYNASGVRQWATYYGGSEDDYSWTCAVDASGYVYLSGETASTSGIAFNGHDNTFGGMEDAFLVKFNSSGVRQWATYYGGSGTDDAPSCVVDSSGNVYLAGVTGSSSGIAHGGHDNTRGGTYDAFLVKFNANGVRQWATYYGGNSDENGLSCAVDVLGNVFLTGETFSNSGIAYRGHDNTLSGTSDGYVVKFNSSGVRQWATYYGGTAREYIFSCAVDALGKVYLAGNTNSAYNGIAYGGHQNSYGGGLRDAFLVKLSASGTREWATYYGGNDPDYGYDCSVDDFGNVYLTGKTSSYSGIASGGYDNILGGTEDAFLVKFNASGVRQWGTYYGGGDADGGWFCTADMFGDVYLSGYTASSSGIAYGGQDNTFGGGKDAFLVKFDDGLSCMPVYYSFNDIFCYGDTFNFNGNLINNAGVYHDTLQNVYGCDSIVTLNLTIDTTVTPIVSISSNQPDTVCAGTSVTYTANVQNGGSTPSYQWMLNGQLVSSNTTYTSSSLNNEDTLVFSLTNHDQCVTVSTISDTIISYVLPVSAVAVYDTICYGDTVNFNGRLISTVGIYHDTLQNIYGCDSIVMLELSGFGHESYTFDQYYNIYNTGGILGYTVSVPNNILGATVQAYAYGDFGGGSGSEDFDVFIDGNQVINNASPGIECGSSYVSSSPLVNIYDEVTGKSSVNVKVNLSSAVDNGVCNSSYAGRVKLVFTFEVPSFTTNPSNFSLIASDSTITTCDSLKWLGHTLYTSGIYIDTLQSVTGCDSIVTLNLTIDTTVAPMVSISSNQPDTVCAGTSVTYTANIQNEGSSPSYQWILNGQVVGSNMTYTSSSLNNGDTLVFTLTNNDQCVTVSTVSDTIISYVLPVGAAIVYDTICYGDTVNFNGRLISTVGIYHDTLQNIYGCDSIVKLELSGFGHESYTSDQYYSIYGTGSYLTRSISVPNNTLGATVQAYAYGDFGGGSGSEDFDVFIDGSQVINNASPGIECGTSYVSSSSLVNIYNEVTGKSSVNVRVDLSSAVDNGVCSSLYAGRVRLVFTFKTLSLITSNSTITTCDSLQWLGRTLYTSGIYIDTLQSVTGCDSIVTLNLTIDTTVAPMVSISSNQPDTLCAGTSVTYTANIQNEGSSPNYQWMLNGQVVGNNTTYTSSSLNNGDTLVFSLTNHDQCLTVSTVSDTIISYVLPVGAAIVYDTICYGDTVNFNGRILSSVGIYHDTLQNIHGCDSTVTLELSSFGNDTYTFDRHYNIYSTGGNLTYSVSVPNNIIGATVQAYAYGDFGGGSGSEDFDVFIDGSQVINNASPDIECGTSYVSSSSLVNIYNEVTGKSSVNVNVDLSSAVNNGVCSYSQAGSVKLVFTFKTSLITSDSTINTCDSLQWLGRTLYTSGIYIDTLQSVTGCDSIVTLNLTIDTTVTPMVSISSNQPDTLCAGTSVTYTANIQNEGSSPNYQWMLNGQVVGNNTTYTSSSLNNGDTLVFSLTNHDQCVTVSTVSDTIISYVLPVHSVILYDTICIGESYNLNGSIISTAGIYHDTLQNIYGCDSIITLYLDYWNAQTNTNIFTSYATIYASGGSTNYTYNLPPNIQSATVRVYDIGDFDASYENYDVYFDGNQAFNNISSGYQCATGYNLSAGTTNVLSHVLGKSSINIMVDATADVGNGVCTSSYAGRIKFEFTFTYTSNATYVHASSAVACNTYTWQGKTYNSSGIYRDTLVSIQGCDSILELNLTIQYPINDTIWDTIYDGQTYMFGANVYQTSGAYTDSLTSTGGCDSILTLLLSVISPCTLAKPITCGQSVYGNTTGSLSLWDNYNCTGWDESGPEDIYTFTLNQTTDVYIGLSGMSVDLDAMILDDCDNFLCAAAIHNSATKTLPAGTYYIVVDGYRGVSGAYTLTFNRNPTNPVANIFSLNGTTVCKNEVVNFEASTSSFGSASVTYQWKKNGINVGVNSRYYSSIINNGDIITCEITVVDGCVSSTLTSNTLNMNVKTYNIYTLNESICQGKTYVLNGNSYSLTGTYRDTIFNSSTCDDIYILNLNVNNTVTPIITITTNNTTVCSNESITFTSSISGGGYSPSRVWKVNGSTVAYGSSFTTSSLNDGDIVTCLLNSSLACASPSAINSNVITVTVLPAKSTNLSASICQGQGYNLNGTKYFSTGTYTQILTSSNGCDSTITLNLTVYPTQEDIHAGICSEDIFMFNGQSLTLPGTYYDTLTSSHGCDSIVTLHLSVSDTIFITINEEICQGDTYTFGNQSYSSAGTYYDTLVSTKGCDSIVTLNLSINPTYAKLIYDTICQGTYYMFGGVSLNTSGVYTHNFNTNKFCDSIVTLNLHIKPVSNVALSHTMCQGSQYTFGGNILRMGGVYYDTTTTANGCDSITSLTLNVEPNSLQRIYDTICQGTGYNFGGNVLTTSGMYKDTILTITGCDSIVELHLFVVPNLLPSITISSNKGTMICQGEQVIYSATVINGGSTPRYQWKRNGNNVGTGLGTYTSTTNNSGDTIICMLTSNAFCVSPTTVTSPSLVMLVKPLPAVNITLNGLTLEATPGYISYEWKLNGSIISGVTTNIFTPTLNGIYEVKVTDTNGCENTAVFNLNSVGFGKINQTENIKVYPNPTAGTLNLEFQNTGRRMVVVFDQTGKVVLDNVFNSKIYSIDMSSFAVGIYQIKTINKNGIVTIKKIVKN